MIKLFYRKLEIKVKNFSYIFINNYNNKNKKNTFEFILIYFFKIWF